MKKLIILSFCVLSIMLASCNGIPENGARIILGTRSSNDTIELPKIPNGLAVDNIDATGGKLYINYRDSSDNIITKRYFKNVFLGFMPSDYIIKFTK